MSSMWSIPSCTLNTPLGSLLIPVEGSHVYQPSRFWPLNSGVQRLSAVVAAGPTPEPRGLSVNSPPTAGAQSSKGSTRQAKDSARHCAHGVVRLGLEYMPVATIAVKPQAKLTTQ